MARKNKSLADAFTQFEESLDNQVKDENEAVNDKQESQQNTLDENPPGKQETIQEDETMNHNTESITKNETPKRNTSPKATPVTEKRKNNQEARFEIDSANHELESSSKTIRDVTNTILNMYEEKSNKKTVEETHTRATFLFRKDLQARLDHLAEGKRGFKTLFLNKAVEAMLDEVEGVHNDK